MNRLDAKEAAGIVNRVLANLASTIPPQGRAGSDARTAIGDTSAHAQALLIADDLGPSLDLCFNLVYQAGARLTRIDAVRLELSKETPQLSGAILVRDACVNFCLAIEGMIIADIVFVSRQDVDKIKLSMQEPFAVAEEAAADGMDSTTFQALVSLHAAISHHLVQTALPLPRMLNYQFFEPLPSLILSYRLYSDAGRADEIRNENKVVHPAFCRPFGKALAA